MASETTAVVTFHRVYSDAFPPMRADKSALGGMPTMAFKHCEPMRAASSMGWYVFPPEDVSLKWNGSDVFYRLGNEWMPLSQADLPGFPEYWNKNSPPSMQGLSPPWLTRFRTFPGAVQIWSGLLCSMVEDWSLLVRPLVNVRSSHLYTCYEGLVEADRFKPFPLFINIQLVATDVVIELPKVVPLFQVVPLMRATYGELANKSNDIHGMETFADGTNPMSEQDWAGYRKTIHVEKPNGVPEEGQYTVATRKRAKQSVD